MKKNIFNVALLLLLAFVAGACSDSDDTKKVDNGRRSGAATQLIVLDNAENELSNLSFSLGASNYIVGIIPEEFVEEAADVNASGSINITDLIRVSRISGRKL